jgi:calpain-7
MVIDSRLPTSSSTTQSLHATVTPLASSPTNTASLLWLPLLEKAYMSLVGSYAFPGSTPATDIHALTGWILERIVLSGAGFRRERTWARIVDGWERGTVLVTLGTGAGVGRNAVSVARVVPLHAYAVVDIHRDTDAPTENGAVNGRMVRVLNPWKRGRTRMDDGPAWTRNMLESLVEEAEDEEAEEPPGE